MATRDGVPNFYSVQIVWQIGMGLILGILFSETTLKPVASGTQSVHPRKLNLGNACLFGVMALVLGGTSFAGYPTSTVKCAGAALRKARRGDSVIRQPFANGSRFPRCDANSYSDRQLLA